MIGSTWWHCWLILSPRVTLARQIPWQGTDSSLWNDLLDKDSKETWIIDILFDLLWIRHITQYDVVSPENPTVISCKQESSGTVWLQVEWQDRGQQGQCVYTMCVQHHVTSSCDIIMWHHHVTSSCDIILWHHHVTSSCDIIMWHHHVTSSCDIIKLADRPNCHDLTLDSTSAPSKMVSVLQAHCPKPFKISIKDININVTPFRLLWLNIVIFSWKVQAHCPTSFESQYNK